MASIQLRSLPRIYPSGILTAIPARAPTARYTGKPNNSDRPISECPSRREKSQLRHNVNGR
ncbi:hypothetical protein BDR05DRAFT_969735 [Suillus weaverae]|nr:hypothetical protein BDR05DRAFT_969735 [Suillus weaverae]